MALEAVVKLTKEQYEILANGGTVGPYTGIDNTKYLYFVQDDISAGSSTRPVYFLNGSPLACAHSLEADVPSDADFNNYYHKTGSWNGLTYTAGKVGNPDDLSFTIPTGTTSTTVALGNHNHDSVYLKLAGGTMTGVLTALGGQYTDSLSTGALNMNNSDIYGLNSIKFADASDNAAEGIQFYRDATHADTLWDSGGVLYYVPNRPYGTGTTAANSNVVLHSGNYSSYAIPKTLTSAKGDIIYASAANTPARLAIGTEGQVLKVGSGGVPIWAADSNTNTWRNVQVDSEEKLGTGTGTGALNFVSQNTNNGDVSFTYSGGIKATAKIPTALKNPNSLGIKVNSESSAFVTYDGSAAKTLTIAPSSTNGAFTISDGTTTKTIQLAGSFTDNNQKVKTSSVTFGANDVVEIKAGSNITVTGDATAKTITIAGTANTATAADNILDGSNSGTEITYAPYTSQQSRLSFDTSTTNPTRTDRLNLNGYFYATKLYSGGTEVSVSGHAHDTRYVRYDSAQGLNNTQKETARSNIGALSLHGGDADSDFILTGAGGETITFTLDGLIKLHGYGTDDSGGILISSQSGSSAKYARLKTTNLTADRNYEFPNKGGTFAMTSDILNPANYYWADVSVSSSSNKGTAPTVDKITIGGSGSTAGKATMQYNATEDCIDFVFA